VVVEIDAALIRTADGVVIRIDVIPVIIMERGIQRRCGIENVEISSNLLWNKENVRIIGGA
jgi:hypothetical protein